MRRSLPRSFRQVPEQISDGAADCIVVAARSSGTLALPGSYSRDAPPGPHFYEIIARGDSGVEVEKVIMGTAQRYHVMFHVRNERDTASTVVLRWTFEEAPATDEPADSEAGDDDSNEPLASDSSEAEGGGDVNSGAPASDVATLPSASSVAAVP